MKLKNLFQLFVLSLGLISCNTRGPFSSQHSYYQKIAYEVKERYDRSTLPSIGEPNILVIPVDFTDYRFPDTEQEVKDRLNDAFFGEREEGDLVESVSSYYYKSSYGKLNIKGTVTDIVTAPKSYNDLKKKEGDVITIISRAVIDKTIDKALTSFSSTYDLSDYDTDGDGILDCIWLVYSAPRDNTRKSVFWGFTARADLKDTYDGLYANAYSWVSYEFLDDGGYTNHPDAHCLIHETGHLLGLADYYDYSTENKKMPTGTLDMMDYNVGDHMAFSKYNLGWIEPEVLTTSGTYTLKPLTSSGDAYIVAAPNYNDTQFWEYYVLEYYTPDGLNQLDAETIYPYSGVQMFTTSGLRLYRVNQKLGYKDSSNVISFSVSSIIQNVNKIDKSLDYVIINSNTPYNSYNTISSERRHTKLVSLISATSGNPSLALTKRIATNDDLFTTGSTFNPTSVNWDDGSSVNFSFTVDSVTPTSLTFTLTKN